jgi:hypothetical protein
VFIDELHAACHFLAGLGDQVLDVLGRACRALCEFANFLGNHGKALSGFPGAGCLDAGVERKKVGLEGNLVDHADDLGDFVRCRFNARHGVDGVGDHAAGIDRADCAFSAMSLASSARVAALRTVAVISSSAAEVSSSEAACCSVRRDRSSVAACISDAPALISWVSALSSAMVSLRRSAAWLKSVRSFSSSPVKACSSRTFRLPLLSSLRAAPSSRTAASVSWSRAAFSASRRWRSASVSSRPADRIRLQGDLFDRAVAQNRQGPGERADFVALILAGNLDVEIAFGKCVCNIGQPRDTAQNLLGDEGRNDCCRQQNKD